MSAWLSLLLALGAAATDMVQIAASEFWMGTDDEELDERPAHRVALSAFSIDRHEVTVGEYRSCVDAKRCDAPRHDPGDATLPVTWVSFRDAERYCSFVGKRLPTEAEWERAARSTDGRRYPWGNEPECARANFGNYRGEGRCPENPGRLTAPGRYPNGASAEGVLDLAGNAWEWVADFYDEHYYAHAPKRDPRGPKKGARRAVRGGACCSMFGLPRAANRLAFPPDYADEDIGFRCAR